MLIGTYVHPPLKTIINRLIHLADKGTAVHFKDLKSVRGIIVALQKIAARFDFLEAEADFRVPDKDWLQRLQDALNELEDMIDEPPIWSSDDVDNDPRNQVFSYITNTFTLKSKLDERLPDLLQDLEKLVMNLELAKDLVKMCSRNPESVVVVERAKDLEKVIDLILKSIELAGQIVPVVPILGSVGIGKTTLAHLVCKNDRIRQNFSRIYFECLGESHDMFHFLKSIHLKSFGRSFKTDDEDTRQQMKKEIHEFLNDKSSLIVLDGFRDNTSHLTAAIESIDMLSNKGSIILLTTSSLKAASLFGTTPAYQLQPLSLRDSSDLFSKMVQIKHRRYFDLAKKLVSSCCGVPLLLTTIGSVISKYETVSEWEDAWNCICEDGFPGNLIQESYYEFSSHSILPLQCFRLRKACGLSVEALTCVWMALGCLYDKTQSPEYMARKNLIELAKSCLCPDVQYAPGGVVQNINFNDALYGVATQSELWITVRNGRDFDGVPMYIIWDQQCTELPSNYKNTPKTKRVRLFMVKPGQLPPAQFVQDIFSCLGHLRVLGLNGCDIVSLPESIGKLKHLRYLDVGGNSRINSLPHSICDLRLLQTLFLHGCIQLKELPAKIGRLQDLRYLTLTILKESFPETACQLTSLWTLALTNCINLASLPTVKNLKNLAVYGCPKLDLAAFKGLDAIQILLLSHLPEFASLPSDLENESAALKHIHILSCTKMTEIKWITRFRLLRSLTIDDCCKLTDLKLINDASKLKDLLELIIRRCPGLYDTTWLKHFVSLQSLIIDACPKLVKLDSGFNALRRLERLEIRGCGVSAEWFASAAGVVWSWGANVGMIEVDGVLLKS